MTQPEYVPISSWERLRPVRRLSVPGHWEAIRPGDQRGGLRPTGPSLGVPGPDQGYALSLAERFEGQLVLTEDESSHDAHVGAVAVALRRAALFGRAPVVFDLEHAYLLWGFLGNPPAELVAYRKSVFRGAAHDYWAQRAIAARVPESTLRLMPAVIRERQGDWRALISEEAGESPGTSEPVGTPS